MSASRTRTGSKTLIVLTGPMAAGKGALEKWAQDKGIPFLSMSEIVEDHAGQPKEELGREAMQDFANAQRRAQGADLYARETAKRIDVEESPLVIVDGMRNVHEYEYFKTRYRVLVVGVVPPSPDRQFENVKKRGRPGDPQTKEHFERVRRRELGHGEDDHGQQVAACLELADAVIVNAGGEDDRRELVSRFEALLRERGLASGR